MLARGRSSEYCQCILAQLFILAHQIHHKLPPWVMLKQSLSTFNEEAGEISFSLLARATLGDTQKSKLQHMSKVYSLIHTYRVVAADLQADTDKDGKACNWRKKIFEDSEEVQSTVSFFTEVLRGIQQGTFPVYDGTIQSFKNKTHATSNMRPYTASLPLWQFDQTGNLLKCLAQLKPKIVSYWGVSFGDIWPELKHHAEDFGEVFVDGAVDPPVDPIDLVNPPDEEEEQLEEDMEDNVEKKQGRMTAIQPSDSEDDSDVEESQPSGSDDDEDELIEQAESNLGNGGSKKRKPAIGEQWSEVGGEGNVQNERPRQRKNRGQNTRHDDCYVPTESVL